VAASQHARSPASRTRLFVLPRLATFRDLRQRSQNAHAPVPAFGHLTRVCWWLASRLACAVPTARAAVYRRFRRRSLYETLIEFGFATGAYGASIDDGLRLVSCVITNAVRCVPPQNKPMPSEIKSCRPFLAATIAALPDLCAIVALGRIAHESVVRAFGLKPAAFPFAHGAEHVLVEDETARNRFRAGARTITLFDSYHCSRYNTNTGVLTQATFRAVFAKLRERL
jgi:uracil-DNA glycosylase